MGAIERKLQEITQVFLKIKGYRAGSYYVKNASLFICEGSKSTEDLLEFEGYCKLFLKCSKTLPTHPSSQLQTKDGMSHEVHIGESLYTAELISRDEADMPTTENWKQVAKRRVIEKLLEQARQYSNTTRDSSGVGVMKGTNMIGFVRFGSHYLMHLPPSFLEENLALGRSISDLEERAVAIPTTILPSSIGRMINRLREAVVVHFLT